MSRALLDRAALVALPVYWVLLATATHYPRVRIPGEVPHGDKLLHFAAFGLLAALCWWFAHARRWITPRFVWLAAAVLIPYAALDEYLQQFVGRHTDPYDFVADAGGIVAVLAALEAYRRWR